MLLTLAEDFTGQFDLDSELMSAPETGYYLNSGVHSYITTSNLLDFLPNVDYTFDAYSAGKTYGKYSVTRNLSDIVIEGGVVYESISDNNIGNLVTDDTKWLKTNIESLRIKHFAQTSKDNAFRKLNLTRRLVENQYIYNLVELNREPVETLLPSNYCGWCFESKGSDYVKIRINQIALQAKTNTPQSLYVINQGQLIDTLTLNPNIDGRLVFETFNYTISGKGVFHFVIDSQVVLTNGSYIEPLKYDGFVAYTCNGVGNTPEESTYSYGTSNNGLNFNVTAFLDGSVYAENNAIDLGEYLQSAWQIDVLNAFLSNPNTRSSNTQRNVMERQILLDETKLTNIESAIKRYNKSLSYTLGTIDKTFDRELTRNNNDGIEITVSAY